MIQAMGKLQSSIEKMNTNLDNKERSFPAQPQANPRGKLNNGPIVSSYENQVQENIIPTLRSGNVIWKEITASIMEENNNRNDIDDASIKKEINNDNDSENEL